MKARKNKNLLSEEDIRTKVVTTWLADHGFGAADILIEKSFELCLGRGILRVGDDKQTNLFRPRADILVRSCDGRNLLIVEVKALNQNLDEKTREQGISYARLLREGGIAPFVVLTNGTESKIFDSISGEQIDGQIIPPEHPFVQNGFRVTASDLDLRAKALEALISLSPDNLIKFCHTQVSNRMRRLRSDEPNSGKKYIPALYVEREEANKKLYKLLNEEKRKVVLLIGPPQVGKTNFVCHTVEKLLLQQGIPCLFYPAIDVNQGLLEEISEDFEWTFGDNSSVPILISKLAYILNKTSQKIIIFIDGWNETSQQLARIIDCQSQKLFSRDCIQLVISMTNVAASRLLLDETGSPSYVAEAAYIDSNAVSLIETSPDKLNDTNPDKPNDTNPNKRVKNRWSTVYLPNYTPKEMEKAYENYADIFKVKVPDEHQKVNDPLLLRVGMELFSNDILPEQLDEPYLLGESIKQKATRAIGLKFDSVCNLLTALAEEIFIKDAPISQIDALKRWNNSLDSLPDSLFEAALLAKVRNNVINLPSLDFYFSRERNFAIAYWARNLASKFIPSLDVVTSELSLAIQTHAAKDALIWFLKQSKNRNHLKIAFEYWSHYNNPEVRIVLMKCLWESVSQHLPENEDWVVDMMEKGIGDSEMLVRVEASKILVIHTQDSERLVSIVATNEELIPNLLEIEEKYPLGEGSAGDVVLEALQELHSEECYDGSDESSITSIVEPLIIHNSYIIRKAAAKVMGYLAPKLFLETLSDIITRQELQSATGEEYLPGIKLAIEKLEEIYYGSHLFEPTCPTYLEHLNDDLALLFEEYEHMYQTCLPIINFYKSYICSQHLLNIVESLSPSINFIDSNFLKYHDIDWLCDILSYKSFSSSEYVQNIPSQTPIQFLYALSILIKRNRLNQNHEIYNQSLFIAIKQIQDIYVKSLSSPQLILSPEELTKLFDRYLELYDIFTPLILFYRREEFSEKLLDILTVIQNILINSNINKIIGEEIVLPNLRGMY